MSVTSVPPVKLLLCDDLDENLLALDALLRRDDLELLKARSGMEALETLLLNDVALALVDVQMPEMDGFELAELMRGSERTSRVPIIFVTAGAREPSRVFQGYDAGAVDFLFKPIDPHILRHKVDTFVELHRQRLQLAAQMETIRKREDELKRVNQELSATLRLNETFVAAVGHDLRTPLNNVVLSAELLRAQISTPSETRVLERLSASAERMSKMIDELFDLARARQGGGIPIMPQPHCYLLPVAERIVGELGGGANGREITLDERGDLHGDWDPDRLGQVLSNLVGNALRHGSPEGPVQIELDGTDGARLVLTVRNRGQIAPDVLSCLFEPFRRGKVRTGSKDGLGLGLFIVEQIVLAHGGTISAESVDAVTTFRVALPRVAPAASDAPAGA
ncbi:MAG TPA: ATP-binding protein [Polyangiales bacterium]|nr:ATP-binding protein [Polyangiales bacterium]